jgi:trehalose 6-phosphate synthase/phosphatase
MNKRLIIISNRLPVQIREENDTAAVIPSSGGLVSSIKSYLQHRTNDVHETYEEVLWIGTLDISEKKSRRLELEKKLPAEDFRLLPVYMSASQWDKYYNGFCNDTLWPLFHYFPSYAKYKDDQYEQYIVANQNFCRKLESVYQPGDVIWIHDYHLLALPAMIRKLFPDAVIGFFLHIPFPSFELFRMIPGGWRKELLEGMLGSDLIGFHTNSYAQYFLTTVKQLLGYEITLRTIYTPERCITTDVFPVGIDFEKFGHVLSDPEIFSARNRIRKRFYDVQLIVSVDRLDYTKGLVNRLEGFELFLNEHPAYRGKVSFIMIIVPSRDVISKYSELKETIEGLVGRINGKFGNIDWLPVVYQYTSVDFQELAALYTAADVALITPVRDGMNLVAKEFVASRGDRRGVLILSETAGASAELGEAILINPTDRREVASALFQALNMPPQEQLHRIDFMQKRLRNYDVNRWAGEFMRQLRSAHEAQENMKIKILTPSAEERICNEYHAATRRLLLFDYDGTLSPLVRFPHLAVPTESIISLLTALCADDRNFVIINSGRPCTTLENWFGSLPVALIAEHGAFIRKAGQSWEQTIPVNTEWKEHVMRVMQKFIDRCPGAFVEEKDFSLAWHFRNADTELGFIQSRELFNSLTEAAADLNFQVIEGKKVIEVRPRGIDKGTAAQRWLAEQEYDFILAIGDDRTDEDLFKVIPAGGYSMRVGLVQTAAQFNIRQQNDVIAFLQRFTAGQRIHLSRPVLS